MITRALTLRPWWAGSILHSGKNVENRSTKLPAAHVGKWIALHAGRTSPALAKAARAGGWLESGSIDRWQALGEPDRAVVGAVKFYGWRPPATNVGPWAVSGCFGWCVDEICVFDEAIDVGRGKLGIWTLPDGAAARVTAAFERGKVSICPRLHPLQEVPNG